MNACTRGELHGVGSEKNAHSDARVHGVLTGESIAVSVGFVARVRTAYIPLSNGANCNANLLEAYERQFERQPCAIPSSRCKRHILKGKFCRQERQNFASKVWRSQREQKRCHPGWPSD